MISSTSVSALLLGMLLGFLITASMFVEVAIGYILVFRPPVYSVMSKSRASKALIMALLFLFMVNCAAGCFFLFPPSISKTSLFTNPSILIGCFLPLIIASSLYRSALLSPKAFISARGNKIIIFLLLSPLFLELITTVPALVVYPSIFLRAGESDDMVDLMVIALDATAIFKSLLLLSLPLISSGMASNQMPLNSHGGFSMKQPMSKESDHALETALFESLIYKQQERPLNPKITTYDNKSDGVRKSDE
ncbi:MAG: hypothetical protein M1834_001526 [Cirrosporium novae-zelandiae]|nr:MAG: hypothetical protein M1834_004043 [Cirrosporium novae-zelandiae]KAI9735511.1 MAG: hypothetical protein M1834_001526 [Cirrosporium novae-zelandiae]